jgi:hypothetical protein
MICKFCQGVGVLGYFVEGCYFEESCEECQETGHLSDSQIRENEKDYLVDYLADLEFGNKLYSLGEFQEVQLRVFRELNQMDKVEPEKVNLLLNWANAY